MRRGVEVLGTSLLQLDSDVPLEISIQLTESTIFSRDGAVTG